MQTEMRYGAAVGTKHHHSITNELPAIVGADPARNLLKQGRLAGAAYADKGRRVAGTEGQVDCFAETAAVGRLPRDVSEISSRWMANEDGDQSGAVTVDHSLSPSRAARSLTLPSTMRETLCAVSPSATQPNPRKAGMRRALPRRATFNRITTAIAERAKTHELPLEPFTVHDLRRTGSTLLNELGFNRDWIEKCLAHEEGGGSRGVYNKAEYEQQRRHMLQEWADMIDAWNKGRNHTPTLLPPFVRMMTPEVTVSPAGSSAAARQGRGLA